MHTCKVAEQQHSVSERLQWCTEVGQHTQPCNPYTTCSAHAPLLEASPLNPVLAIHPPGRRCKVVLIGSGPLAGGAGIGWAGELGEPHWALVPAAGWAAQEGQTDTQRPCAGDRWLVCWLSGEAPAGLSTGCTDPEQASMPTQPHLLRIFSRYDCRPLVLQA